MKYMSASQTTVQTVEDLATDASIRPLVVLGVDPTSTAAPMIEWAALEAIARGAALEIVTCSEQSCAEPTCAPATCTARHTRRFADAVAATRELHPLLSIIETTIGPDTPNSLTTKAASADLLIVGESHLGSSTRQLIGAPSRLVVRRTSCPVIALRGQQHQPLRRIVAGIDDTNAAAAALDWAADEADRQGAELTIIHAWQRPRRDDNGSLSMRDIDTAHAVARRILDNAVERCTLRMGRPVSSELVDGSPAAALADASMNADLIAVGSRGSTGYRTMLFGSVATFVLESADCPVAVIHPRVRVASDSDRDRHPPGL
jgi:nucleotide-binding universal stress UspA family protein